MYKAGMRCSEAVRNFKSVHPYCAQGAFVLRREAIIQTLPLESKYGIENEGGRLAAAWVKISKFLAMPPSFLFALCALATSLPSRSEPSMLGFVAEPMKKFLRL